MKYDIVRVSKYMSYLLRHHPEAAGLRLDEHGWADAQTLVSKLQRKFPGLSMEDVERVVRENDKQRFSFDETHERIRANQGHTIPVDVEMKIEEPPEILWHGTGRKYAASIDREGLKPKSRLYVHLSKDRKTAEAVGRRHGEPVIYLVMSGQMQRDGYTFRISENGVWQVKEVPVKYLRKQERTE